MRTFASPSLFVAAFLSIVSLCVAQDDENGGFDHRAHSVPGLDQTVYDIDGDGAETIHLNGAGSHSHYFRAGPPIVSGSIEKFTWRDVKANRVFCTEMECEHPFPVGETEVSLTVEDNTQDVAMDTMKVMVRPRSAVVAPPRIESLSPNRGQAAGGNTVTIAGSSLYRDAKVFFGRSEAIDCKHEDLEHIVCTAPGGSGTATVTVESSIGNSNGVQYTFQDGSNTVPIRFLFDTWKNTDLTEYVVQEITSITIGRDHRYYMGSLTGSVTAVYVDRDLVVRSTCTGADMGDGRSITGIAFNPLDPFNRVFVTTNTHFHVSRGERWDNARVEIVNIGTDDCPIRGDTLISGLPTSNHDHGTNAIAFLPDGRMLVTVGSFSNAGASRTDDGIGGVPENPLSASVVVADYLAPDFNGEILYDQYGSPETALVISGDVETYAVGLRNSFGLTLHSNGEVYATDNGPNTNFGRSSTSCTTDGPDPESEDKLLHIVEGNFYGHPNRNRGRFDSRQCRYRFIDEPTGDGYTPPIGTMTSSTNGIMEYRANVFEAGLKGDLIMSKVAFGANGLTYRAQLNEDGESLVGEPFQFYDQSGVSVTMGLYGEIVMPQLKKYRVIALRPDEPAAKSVNIIAVHPSRGPAAGGNEVFITGHFLNGANVRILFGDKPCTDLTDVRYQHVRCTVPAGTGQVPVIATAGGATSISFGHEYEYL